MPVNSVKAETEVYVSEPENDLLPISLVLVTSLKKCNDFKN